MAQQSSGRHLWAWMSILSLEQTRDLPLRMWDIFSHGHVKYISFELEHFLIWEEEHYLKLLAETHRISFLDNFSFYELVWYPKNITNISMQRILLGTGLGEAKHICQVMHN